MFNLNKYFTRISSNETSRITEHTPLVPRENLYQETRQREQISETERPEAKGPNPLTGEGMESQKLKAEANGLWKRVRGMDVNRVYVEKLTAAYDQRYDRICSLVMKDKKLTQEVLDCSRNDFLEDLDYLKDVLKKNLSENALDRNAKPEHKARALKFLEAAADLQQHLERRLEHTDSRLEIKEVFKSLDKDNCRAYLTIRNEVRQSIRAIGRMYKEVEGTYTPSEIWRRVEQGVDKWIADYNNYAGKFMMYFTGRTWLDNPSQKINDKDIEKLRELGTDIVKFEAAITQMGIAEVINLTSKKLESNQRGTSGE